MSVPGNPWHAKAKSAIGIAENELRKFAAHYDGLQTTNLSLGELIEHEPLRTEVIKDLRKYGIKAGLVEFELLSGLIMVSENWDKKLRQWDGTVDREKLVAKYSLNIQVLAARPGVMKVDLLISPEPGSSAIIGDKMSLMSLYGMCGEEGRTCVKSLGSRALSLSIPRAQHVYRHASKIWNSLSNSRI